MRSRLTPAMSSTSSVLRILATWAAMVVPNVIGPEGMRLGGPSLAPVGLNKHKLWEQKGKQKQGQKMLNTDTRAVVFEIPSANILCTYTVAFSQEVKCKSICFCCCRNNRCISDTVKLSVRGTFCQTDHKHTAGTPKEKCDKEATVHLKLNVLTMSYITMRALWPWTALSAILFFSFPVCLSSPISHWYMGHFIIKRDNREDGGASADQEVNELCGLCEKINSFWPLLFLKVTCKTVNVRR